MISKCISNNFNVNHIQRQDQSLRNCNKTQALRQSMYQKDYNNNAQLQINGHYQGEMGLNRVSQNSVTQDPEQHCK